MENETNGNLNKGKRYDTLVPVTIVGILNFTLFRDHAKFFSKYKVLEEEDLYPYSDKLTIKILDLKQIDKAKEGKDDRIKEWAEMFRANSFEELEKAAAGKEVFQKMVARIKQLTADERMRYECGRGGGVDEG